MGKNIILLSDGTGNSSRSPFKTNVWRLYQALVLSPDKQIAFYDDGVGTSSFRPLAILGGALGLGLARNVREIYTFLCLNYKPGDRIYGYGFSRGAFTMRAVVALIAHQGIIDPRRTKGTRDLQRLVRDAYRVFHREAFGDSALSYVIRVIRDGVSKRWEAMRRLTPYDAKLNLGYLTEDQDKQDHFIRFIGVWDTVAAYGLPVDEMTHAWDRMVWPLTSTDRDLSKRVQKACHVIAIDDERETFHPELWNESGETGGRHIDEERITQVWFAGVHTNVGGGYPDDSLSHVSLDWMCRESEKAGVIFNDVEIQRLRAQQNPFGPLYDSRRGAAGYYRYTPRHINDLIRDQRPGWSGRIKTLLGRQPEVNQVIIDCPKIHHSVFQRICSGIDHYAPFNLPDHYAVVSEDGAITRVDKPDHGLSAALLETQEQAVARYQAQEQAWNWVWLRRVVYFLTVFTTLFMVGFPLLWARSTNGNCTESWTCFLADIPALIGSFLPSMAQGWIATYQHYPLTFSVLGLAIFGMMLWSNLLKSVIQDHMRRHWRHVIEADRAVVSNPLGRPGRLLLRIRTHGVYRGAFGFLKGFVFEFVFMVLFAMLVVVGASRLVHAWRDSTGQICPEVSPSKLVTPTYLAQPAALPFPANSPCWASGFKLTADHRYQLTLTLPPDGPWRDDNIVADLGGWTPTPTDPEALKAGEVYEPSVWQLAIPLRRHLSQPWYMPVARIGRKGMDIYPLSADEPMPPQREQRRQLTTTFTSRSTGPLYLYVNDAVLFSPTWPLTTFYANNQGQATVEITELKRSPGI